MADAHSSPNYWMIWLYLFALTVVELVVILPYLGIPKLVVAILLVTLACYKAFLVAMYFMHLKFERRTLGIIALTPFVLCVFLILMLLPDIS
jgi:cytochrome c oxidase subunit 4